MARKNSIKRYIKGGYYHVYNRGVGKQDIYKSEIDYKVFLDYLKYSLSPPPDPKKLRSEFTLKDGVFKGVPRLPKNYHNKLELVSFCLMPNHFHLLIKQNQKSMMKEFLHSLSIRYSMYFNKVNNRVGPLFQGRYKAALVTTDTYLVYLTCYIHANPYKLTSDLTDWYSSYPDYLGITNTAWIHPESVLELFAKKVTPDFNKFNSYKAFVEGNMDRSTTILDDLTLE